MSPKVALYYSEENGPKQKCEDQENTAIMPKFWNVTLAGDDSRNIQTHKVILVTINHVKEGFKENTSIHTLSSTREGVGTKQDDDMEVETKKVGKNGPAIAKNIYSCHLKEQEEESFPCDVCGKTYNTKGGQG